MTFRYFEIFRIFPRDFLLSRVFEDSQLLFLGFFNFLGVQDSWPSDLIFTDFSIFWPFFRVFFLDFPQSKPAAWEVAIVLPCASAVVVVDSAAIAMLSAPSDPGRLIRRRRRCRPRGPPYYCKKICMIKKIFKILVNLQMQMVFKNTIDCPKA